MYYTSANRDEDVFDDSQRFDIHRHPNPHLSFGIAEHYCLGVHVARLEGRVFFEELLATYPTIELDRRAGADPVEPEQRPQAPADPTGEIWMTASPPLPPQHHLAAVHEAIAARLPDRECIVFRDRRLTYAEVTDRTRRLAHALHERGLGARPGGRTGLAGHESHHDHLAIYAYNGNEYLEAMLGAFKARVAPINVNYKYVAEELRYVLLDSRAKAVVYHSAFAPNLAAVLPDLPDVRVLLQIADDSGNELLPGAEWYEDVLAAAPERSAELGRRVVTRRPLHPLHRRHHRDAEGRAVAPGRHPPDRHGRAEPGDPRAVGEPRRAGRVRGGQPGALRGPPGGARSCTVRGTGPR